MKPKTKVIVRLTSDEDPDLPFIKPYMGKTGEVVEIDRSAYSLYQLRVRFPEEIDIAAFGHVLEYGFWTYSRHVEAIEGNLDEAYYGLIDERENNAALARS